MTKRAEKWTDPQLVDAVRMGDQDAFGAFYFRYAESMFRFLWRRTGHREASEDLVQELFTRVWKNRGNLDSGRSIKAYLYKSAHHLAIDHLRKKVIEPISDEALPEAQVLLDETGFEKRQQIQTAVSQLPRGQRMVFCLSRYEGLTYPEIAAVLAISVKTVENHMSRALKKLRVKLGGLVTHCFFEFLL